MTYDTEKIKEENPLEVVIGQSISLTQDGKEYQGLCPFHSEKTPSFSVAPEKGFAYCFGCGEYISDVIEWVMKYNGVDFPTACDILGGTKEAPNPSGNMNRTKKITKDVYEGIDPIIPIPSYASLLVAGSKTPKIYNPKRAEDPKKKQVIYNPSMVFKYGDHGYVLRIDIGKAKITPTVMWCKLKDGTEQWCHYAFPEPRPLYIKDSGDTNSKIIVVEGEKAADAASRLLPHATIVTWSGGSNGISKSDWSFLKGRKCLAWPDADAPGEKAMTDVALIVTEIGVEELKIINWDQDKPKGWDIADAESEGWDRAQINKWLSDRLTTYFPFPKKSLASESRLPILSFKNKERENSLFKVTNALVKGGMDEQNIKAIICMLASTCIPPFPPEEADIKIELALKRIGLNISENKSRVRQWVDQAVGEFRIADMMNQIGNVCPDQKQTARLELQALCEEGVIAANKSRDGIYKKLDIDLKKMTRVENRKKEMDLWLPFGLHNKAVIIPGSLILVAGVSNAGKSAFLLNFTEKNMDKHKIRYVSSEWSNEERDTQLEDFGVDIDLWDKKVDFYAKKNVTSSFDNYIDPENVTIIDYYEKYDDYAAIAGDLRDIADKLTTGVAIVAMQKRTGATHAVGGEGTVNRSQLYINIDINETDPRKRVASIRKLKKAKIRGLSIERLSCEFQYNHKGRIVKQGDWGKIVETREKGKDPVKSIMPERWANKDDIETSFHEPKEDEEDEQLDEWGEE